MPFPTPSSPFYKIMVPTVDTVRYNYLVSTMVASQNPVLLVGPVGTGKTMRSTQGNPLQRVLEVLWC